MTQGGGRPKAARSLVGAAEGGPHNGNVNKNIANIDKMSGPGPKSARPGRIFGALNKAHKKATIRIR